MKLLIAPLVCWKYEYPFAMGRYPAVEAHRIATVRRTWWPDIQRFDNVQGLFFYGRPPEPKPTLPGDGVILDCADSYVGLAEKFQAAVNWALRHTDFDYLMKCDDDTGVDVAGVLRELREDPQDYAGNKISVRTKSTEKPYDYCYGGTGFIVSRQAAEILATAPRLPEHGSAEDVWTGKILSAHYRPYHYPGHDEIITKHCRQPGQMDDWYRKKVLSRHP